jgi:hypothetical protein
VHWVGNHDLRGVATHPSIETVALKDIQWNLRAASDLCADEALCGVLGAPAMVARIASRGAVLICALALSMPVALASGPKLESLLGREVSTSRDGEAGRIIDLLTNADGGVRAAVIEFGGFLGIGTRKIAVDWSALRFVAKDGGFQIVVDVSREQLRATPEYKPGEPPVVVGRSPIEGGRGLEQRRSER